MELTLLVPLLLLGGVAVLDTTSVGQIMLSRSLIAGTLAGAVLDDPATGLVVGGFLEFFLLPVVPVGGRRFPEGGSAAVVGASAAVVAGAAGGLALGLAAGLIWSVLAGGSVQLLRHLNERIVPDPSREHVTARRIRAAHLQALGLDFARGVLLTAVGLLVWLPLARIFSAVWPLDRADTMAVSALAGAVPLGLLLGVLGTTRRRLAYFGSGVVLGLLPWILL